MQFGDRPIGGAAAPFFIAELSANHLGSLDRALAIVDAMGNAGASAVKLQTYTADTMTLDVDRPEFTIQNPASPWFGRRLHELYDEAHTPWDWHQPLFERAASYGMLGFSSPFDATAVAFLDELDVPAMKIASSELVDTPLIRTAAATGRPLIMSTGMSDLAEIDRAVSAAREGGCDDLVLLVCTTTYPADPADANLATMADLRERYDCEVGLSDHTLGVGVAIGAVALGAAVVEKHVTLRRADGGVDSGFSLEPGEVETLVEGMAAARVAIGEVRYGPAEGEAGARTRRRSLYVVRDVPAGHRIGSDDVRSIRPGAGLAPHHLDDVLGLTTRRMLTRGTPLQWDDLARP